MTLDPETAVEINDKVHDAIGPGPLKALIAGLLHGLGEGCLVASSMMREEVAHDEKERSAQRMHKSSLAKRQREAEHEDFMPTA